MNSMHATQLSSSQRQTGRGAAARSPSVSQAAATATAPMYLAGPHARVGSIIPREVVVWLQSLQLSRPVKVPRRDLANGFLVAEMCSRYWPAQVSMHSYENLLSTQNKMSNWALLQKVFDRQGAPLSDKVVDGIMNGKAQYADVFLTQLYSLLTGKSVCLTTLPLDNLPEPVTNPDVFEPTSANLAAGHGTDLARSAYVSPPNVAAQLESASSRAAAQQQQQRQQVPPARSAAAALEDLDYAADMKTAGVGGRQGAALATAAPATTASTQRTSRPMEQGVGPATLRTNRKDSVGATLEAAGAEKGGGHFLVDVHVRAATQSTTVVNPAAAHATSLPLGRATTTTTAAGGRAANDLSGLIAGSHRSSLPSAGAVSTGSAGAATSSTSHTHGTSAAVSAVSAAATAASLVPDTAAVRLVENVVRQAAERLHCAWEMPRSSGACPFVLYFLLNETTLDQSTQTGIWSAVLSSLQDLVQLLRVDSTLMPSVVLLFLCVGSQSPSRATAAASVAAAPSTAPVPMPRSIACLAAVFTQLASLDPFHALATFQSGLLAVPAVHGWLQRATYTEADQFAMLACATISPDRNTAASLLPDVLSSVYETVTHHAKSADAVVVFYLILRATAVQLVRPAALRRSAPGNGGTTSPGVMSSARPATHSGTLSGRTDKEDPLNVAMLHVMDFNTIAALSSSAAAVRLVGFALATTAVRLGAPLHTVLNTHARLMFPALAASRASLSMRSAEALASLPWQMLLPITDDPALHVVRAQWVRAVQERLAAMEHDGTVSAAAEQPATRSSDAADGGVVSEAAVASTSVKPMMGALVAALSALVSAPGGNMKGKALIAYELACSLAVMPQSFSSSPHAQASDAREAVADTVVTFFATRASADVVRGAVGTSVALLFPATSADGADAAPSMPRSPSRAALDEPSDGLLWRHALLGPLSVHHLCARSSPLFLSLAVSRLASRLSTVVESKKEAARRLPARASILAKEGNVAASTRMRIEWLYFINVGYGGTMPTSARELSATAVCRLWETVLQDAYVDCLLILSAEELINRMQQNGGAAGATSTSSSSRRPLLPAQESVLALAVHVKAILQRWFMDLAACLGGDRDDGDDVDAAAITWYHQLCGDVESH